MDGLARFEPKHDCPLDILQDQQHLMGLLLDNLEKRAIIEDIDLEMIFESEKEAK